MTDNTMAVLDAQYHLDVHIEDHKSAAIPSMIGACVIWAVDNGGTELIKSTLLNAVKMADQMQAIREKHAQ